MAKTIKETKCTCQACGNIWYYSLADIFNIRLTTRCPKCGSFAMKKEKVAHNLDSNAKTDVNLQSPEPHKEDINLQRIEEQRGKRKSKISAIISYFFVALFLISGIATTNSVISSVIYILVAIYLMPPVNNYLFQQLKLGDKYKIFLNITIAFVLFVLAGSFLPKEAPPPEQAPKQTTVVKQSVPNEVIVDGVNYKIIKMLAKKIPLKDRFILSIGLQITNLSNEPKSVSGDMLTLYDEAGAKYSPSQDIYTGDINPGLSTAGLLLYELPYGIKGLKLKIQSGFFGDKEDYLIISR